MAEAKEEQVNDEASSVMSSTFSLGEPVPTNENIDSDAEGEFNEVVEGIKKSNLKDIPAATRRPSRPHHSAAPEDAKSTATASSVTADGEEASIESSLTRCLFCNYDSQTVFKNAVHMEKLHGMFIPEKPYLVDLDGLIESLREKIHDLQECLYCGKLKPTVFGLQTHMRDKGHCKIPFETELDQLEIGGFYDFRSTYSDDEDESDSDSEDALPGKNRRGGVKLGATRPSKVAGEDGEAVEEGEGWETDSSASSVDSADLDQRKQAHKNSHSVFYSEYELHLPSGRTAGHRSLNKYFKQNLHNHPSAEERQEQLAIEAAASSDSDEEEGDQRVARRNERERGRALTSRANGGTGMIGVSDDKKKAVLAVENRSKKIEERERRKFQWGNNKQSNFQKHFRVSYPNPLYVYLVLTIVRIIFCSNWENVEVVLSMPILIDLDLHYSTHGVDSITR